MRDIQKDIKNYIFIREILQKDMKNKFLIYYKFQNIQKDIGY